MTLLLVQQQLLTLRLWGMPCTSEHAVAPEIFKDAKSKGINKSTAQSTLESKLPIHDHSPYLQSDMKKTADTFKSPCLLSRGLCRLSPCYRQQTVLHKSLLKGIKAQLQDYTVPKDVLISGDLVVAVRFRTSLAPLKMECKMFWVPKVFLRPESLVLVSLEPDSQCNARGQLTGSQIATLKTDCDLGFELQTSWELCATLLQTHLTASENSSPLWVNVLKYTPELLSCRCSFVSDCCCC